MFIKNIFTYYIETTFKTALSHTMHSFMHSRLAKPKCMVLYLKSKTNELEGLKSKCLIVLTTKENKRCLTGLAKQHN